MNSEISLKKKIEKLGDAVKVSYKVLTAEERNIESELRKAHELIQKAELAKLNIESQSSKIAKKKERKIYQCP